MDQTEANDRDGQNFAKTPERSGTQGERRTSLFLRIRAGESHLFGVLVVELSDLLGRRLRRDTRTRPLADNSADMEDVLQQTFLRLWEFRDRFDATRGVIDVWAWGIARNAAVDVLRRRSRTPSTTSELDAAEDKRAADPAAALVAAEERQAFVNALERVANEKVRRALELRLVVGLPYAEVSKEMGVPLGTVANWVYRLRRSLRAEIFQAA